MKGLYVNIPLTMFGKLNSEILDGFNKITSCIDQNVYVPFNCEKEFIDDFHNNFKIQTKILDPITNDEITRAEIIIEKVHDNVKKENNYKLISYHEYK